MKLLVFLTFLLFSIGAKSNALMLVLANDSSASISNSNYELQMRAYAQALQNPELDIILSSYDQVNILIFEWASSQQIIVPCTVLNRTSRDNIVNILYSRTTRANVGASTGIGSALEFGYIHGSTCMPDAERRVIDLAGDGVLNIGIPIAGIRNTLIDQGWTINTLAIIGSDGDISAYFREFVQGGEGSFTIIADGFENFARAIRRKLISEIARGNQLWELALSD